MVEIIIIQVMDNGTIIWLTSSSLSKDKMLGENCH